MAETVVNTDDIRGGDGHPWPRTMDAQAWVTAWMRITADKPEIAKDPATMITWFANSIMAGYDEADRRARASAAQSLSASESLWGFVGWLTSRREPITLSATHNAAMVVQLVRAFCQRHELPEPREEWALLLKDGVTACAMCGGAGTVVLGAEDNGDVIVVDYLICPGPA
jgi:hypothetical protein